MQFLKIIFFIISSMGFYLRVSRRTKLKKEFIPILIISIITVIVFIAGILNFMKITTILIGTTGFILAINEFINIIKNKTKIKLNFSLLIFFILLCLMVYLLNGIKLTNYDDFSHWGLIVKDILQNDRLPNSTSKTIMFISYPPSTACFIYYVCSYLGASEALMLFAQSIIILSSIYTIFAMCKKENKISWIIAILLSVYLLLGNIFINMLLVDCVLAVMGIASLLIIKYYKDDSKYALFNVIPILSALILVKNSGIFFVIVNLIIWLIYYIKNHVIKEIFKTKYILWIFVPFLLLFIWNAHTDLVFSTADTAKHSMSITNYKDVFEEKTLGDIKEIFKLFVKENMSISKENILIIALLAGFIVMLIIANKELRKGILAGFVTFVITYAIYQISLFAMYIFSMPLVEAKVLASYTRYHQTILLFEFGIFVYTALNFMNNYNEKAKKISIEILVGLIVVLAIILAPNKIDRLYKKTTIENTVRYEIMNIKNKNNIKEGKRYLIYIPDDKKYDQGYIYFLCRYEFMSANVYTIKKLDNIKTQMYNYDYIIFLGKSEEVKQTIEELGGETGKNAIEVRKKSSNINSIT